MDLTTTVAQWRPPSVEQLWTERLRGHLDFHNNVEKQAWLKVVRAYRGKFFDQSKTDNIEEHKLLATSLNMIYAVADSSTTSLAPPNPKVTVERRGKSSLAQVRAGQGVINYSLDKSHTREVNKLAILDTMLFGRGLYKTVWNSKEDCGIVQYADPYGVFFDLTARMPKDIQYWIGAALRTPDEFKEMVARGLYPEAALSMAQVTGYPKWLDRGVVDKKKKGLNHSSSKDWVITWEVYDVQKGKTLHFADAGGSKVGNMRLLLEEDLDYVPYSMLNFTHNGEDCRGMPELQLILANQEELNHVRSNVLETVQRSLAVAVLDGNALDETSIDALVQARPGQTVPVKREGSNPTPLSELFHQRPHLDFHVGLLTLMDMLKSDISVISALADVQRGQVTGAKTATELALLESQMRTRLGSRQAEVQAVHADFGAKLLYLNAAHMQREKAIQLEDGTDAVVEPTDIRDITSTYQLTAYSPIAQNRAVVQDVVKGLLPILMGSPVLDHRKLFAALFSVLDIPELKGADLFLPQAPAGPPAEPMGPTGPAGPLPLAPSGGTVVPEPAALPGPQAAFSENATNGPGGVAST